MYSKFAERKFKEAVGSDSDYLIIGIRENKSESFSFIPSTHGTWETMDEAIEWYFDKGYEIIEIYDLYAEFYQSMVRFVTKTTDEVQPNYL